MARDMEPEEKPKVGHVVPGKGHRFAPGHVKMGGRPKGSSNRITWLARQIAESNGFNPMQFILNAVATGQIPGPGGKGVQDINAEERLKCARELMRYVLPTLSAVQVTGADEGPVTMANFDVTELMRDPKLAEAAQTLALALTESKVAQNNPDNWDTPKEVNGEVLTDED